MSEHVLFVDRFVGRVELTRWLEAADVIAAPYADLEQTVAGTLTYAMGAGRPVVATPFAHAKEMLADGRGVVVPPADPQALAAAIIGLLADPDGRAATGRRAHEHTRSDDLVARGRPVPRPARPRRREPRDAGRLVMPVVALGA